MSTRSLFPSLSSYHDKSLRPPPDSGDAKEKEMSSWDWGEALIDCVAYMIDDSNHTSARIPFTTREGNSEELQVTFCLSPPPHVSHFCVGYTSGKPTRFILEPLMLATEGNLALICVKHGHGSLAMPTDHNFLVYHAPTRGHELPNLELLPHPEPGLFPRLKYSYFTEGEVGFLRYRTCSSGIKKQLPFTPPTPTLTLARRPFIPYTNNEEYDAYKIATLHTRYQEKGATHYDLFLYDSKTFAWSREPTVFPQEPPQTFRSHRVLTIDGTMVWVDLSQGIILCDLHAPPGTVDGSRQLRYIRLPEPVEPQDGFPYCVSTESFSRDIAVVEGRIKVVDIEIHDTSPGLISWTAVTWSMSVGDSEFRKDGELKSADIVSSDALHLGSFFVAHPTLSSHRGDTLYMMAKPRLALDECESIVVAVDMKKKKMERVAKYTTQREGTMDFAYMLTTISKYLAPPGDSKASIRKRGPASLGGSSRRKVPAFASKAGLVRTVEEEEEEEDHSKNPPSMDDHGDNMDLD